MTDRYRIMAVDYGTKRVGIAVSDELRMLASGRGVMENKGDLAKSITELALKENVKIVLLGLPKSLSGKDSEMTTEVRAFAEKLNAVLTNSGIAFELRDERLTSVMANFNISQSGLPKNRREEKSLRDEEAARILLQEYLDTHKFRSY